MLSKIKCNKINGRSLTWELTKGIKLKKTFRWKWNEESEVKFIKENALKLSKRKLNNFAGLIQIYDVCKRKGLEEAF